MLYLEDDQGSGLSLFGAGLCGGLRGFRFLLRTRQSRGYLVSIAGICETPSQNLVRVFFLHPFRAFRQQRMVLAFMLK